MINSQDQSETMAVSTRNASPISHRMRFLLPALAGLALMSGCSAVGGLLSGLGEGVSSLGQGVSDIGKQHGDSNWNGIPGVYDSGLGLGEYGRQLNVTRSYIMENSKKANLPEKFVSESRIGIADVERTLATARALEVEHAAHLLKKTAHIRSIREEAKSEEIIALSQAEKVRQEVSARESELASAISSQRREMESFLTRNKSTADALQKERQTVNADMLSKTEAEYKQAQAFLVSLRATRQSVEEEGYAVIDDLRMQAEASRTRAQATTTALRTEAAAINEQTAARNQEMKSRISSFQKQVKASSARLAAQARNEKREAISLADELEARSQSHTAQASEENYELRIQSAESDWSQGQSLAEQAMASAQFEYDRDISEVHRLQADARAIEEIARAQFDDKISEADAWVQLQTAEVDKVLIVAERSEVMARTNFVKAEAAARARAFSETATHQHELAEAQMKAIVAESEAVAKSISSEILNQYVKKQSLGSVEFEGKTVPSNLPENLHVIPKLTPVVPVSPRVGPEHIATYKTALANVMRDRATAQAMQLAIDAVYNKTSSEVEATLTQQLAFSTEKRALSNAAERQADAELGKAQARASSQLAVAEAEYNHQLVEAESFRKDSIAHASELMAQAKAIREIGLTKSEQMQLESEVIARNGESEVLARQAELKAMTQRGEAQYNDLLAESESISVTENALATDLDAQVVATQRALKADLTRIERSIASSETIAEANYDESIARALAFSKKADSEIASLRARNELEYALAQSEIEHIRNLALSKSLRGEAEVDRLIAIAHSNRSQADALADVKEATAYAEAQIAQAQVKVFRDLANAREDALKSLFDTRLVQAEADRVQEIANQYREDFIRRTNLEMATATAQAAQAESRIQLINLDEQKQRVTNAGLLDWDARLAALRYPELFDAQGRPLMKMVSPFGKKQLRPLHQEIRLAEVSADLEP